MFDRALRLRFAALVALLTGGLFIPVDANAPTREGDPVAFGVHEWGTFTSVAGLDGGAEGWMPLDAQDDLPCFVRRLKLGPKWSLWGTVRMETPVVYFYSDTDVTVDVNVRFHQGVITEWFPQATVKPSRIPATGADMDRRLRDYVGSAAWTSVRVRPRAQPRFLQEASPSHYYPARETDASPVQVGNALERFLFYRGVGEFAPPVNARVEADGRIVVSAASGESLGDIVAFEKRNGVVRYASRRVGGTTTTIDGMRLESNSQASLDAHLERVLIAHGLYPKEARAMIATWRDTWFEEGTRIFYIAPERVVDAVLPLDIVPRPKDIARVFVGRIELLTRDMHADIRSALIRNDQQALARYGRFLQPFMNRVFAESSAADTIAMNAARQEIYQNWRPPFSACR